MVWETESNGQMTPPLLNKIGFIHNLEHLRKCSDTGNMAVNAVVMLTSNCNHGTVRNQFCASVSMLVISSRHVLLFTLCFQLSGNNSLLILFGRLCPMLSMNYIQTVSILITSNKTTTCMGPFLQIFKYITLVSIHVPGHVFKNSLFVQWKNFSVS